MLPAYIIDEIRRRQREREAPQPQPRVERPAPTAPDAAPEESERGVWITSLVD